MEMDKASLVDQIKGLQRSDPAAKQAWWDYCDTQLGGIKDPNRHEGAVLQEFYTGYTTGTLEATPPPPKPVKGPPAWTPAPASSRPISRPSTPGGGILAAGGTYAAPLGAQVAYLGQAAPTVRLSDFVKTGQRQSQYWKQAWQAYVSIFGNGMNDPSKYDEAFIVAFIDYVGQVVLQDLPRRAEELGKSVEVDMEVPAVSSYAGKRALAEAMPHFSAPLPNKRAALGHGIGAPAPVADGSEKFLLVEKVKALQRTDPLAKEAWWAFCDEQNGGIKDPNRHDEESLRMFLANY